MVTSTLSSVSTSVHSLISAMNDFKKRVEVRDGKQIDEGSNGGVGTEIPFSQTSLSFNSRGGRSGNEAKRDSERRSNFLNWIFLSLMEMDQGNGEVSVGDILSCIRLQKKRR